MVDDAIKAEFPPSETSPVVLAARAGDARAIVRAFAARLPACRSRRRAVGEGRIDLIAPGEPLGDRGEGPRRDVRAVDAPFERLGRRADGGVRRPAGVARRPSAVALAILGATTLMILFFMTRSVVLPIKALVMNLLTLSAAFGLLVLVFQDGRLEWLLRFDSPGAIESVPAGAAVRGRVRPVHRLRRVPARAYQGAARRGAARTRRRSRSGLQRTGRIVTFAALLMVIAIGCFVTAQIIFIKQLGFGVAVAVLIDATIVRALLVPALMRLLGRLELVGAAPDSPNSCRRERDRLPRAGLQRRRPARRTCRRRSSCLWAHDVVRAGVLLGLRDRAGRRGARPAARSTTRACGSRRGWSRSALLDACKAVERAFGRKQAGEDGYVKHGPRRDRRRRAAARRR